MSSYHDEKQTASDDGSGGRVEPVEVRDHVVVGPPPFKISSLWKRAEINPLNRKSYTLPIFNLADPYCRNFHLAWLGFFVAFLSWFAFPPLIPEAIRADLRLTPAQVGNSNIVALCATLIVRFVNGPLVDRFGPRYVMAGLLIAGAIPSGLAGTAHNAQTLYAIRFFIGILGGTFVPCVAWTTAFFDKNIVGTANAFVAGWGNAGGGATFAIMVSLYQRLTADGFTRHTAWRWAFVMVPVPILVLVAVLTIVFGTDHPAGKWSQRHNTPATAVAVMHGHVPVLDSSEARVETSKSMHQTYGVPSSGTGGAVGKEGAKTDVVEASEDAPTKREREISDREAEARYESEVDVAVNEKLTMSLFLKICANPLTWLPALSYMTSFGFELAVDANLANILFAIYVTRFKDPRFGTTQVYAGYLTSIYGLLNIWTRPLGGYLGDLVYRRWGVPGKKYLTLGTSFIQGVISLAMGLWYSHELVHGRKPDLATFLGLLIILAIFNEVANGANFSLVPHCNAYSNGTMSGIVGGFGNLGGIFFALIFRFQPAHNGAKAFWISGIFTMAVNALLCLIRVPKR